MTKPLTNVQSALLQTFQYQLSEEEFSEFNQMLIDYFADKLSDDMDRLFEEKGWGKEKYAEWSAAHLRTPYRPQS